MTAVRPEPRETSGATTGGPLRSVRAQAGDAAVAEVIRRAGMDARPEELDDPSRWWGCNTRIRLFAAATEVLADPDTMFDADGLAERVVACFDSPFRLDGAETNMGTSVGVAGHDSRRRTTAEELLRRADAAMYRHKERTATPTPRTLAVGPCRAT